MKNNKLLLGSAAFAGALLFSATLYLNNTAQYSPKINEQAELNEEAEEAKEAAGAAEWLFNIQKNPLTGRVDEADVLKSRDEVAQFLMNNQNSTRAALGLQWNELGPDNVGGRTRGILIDKNNPNKLYACSIGGGLWISTNGGSNWSKYNDQMEHLGLSCITQAANGDIYIGTGEDLYNNIANGVGPGGMLGAGIFKSSDGGVTFVQLPATIPTTANSLSNSGNEFIGVNNLAADPVNANRIYAATRYGLRMTNDGGATWTHAATSTVGNPLVTRATDVDVATDGTVIASIGNKLYISANGDQGTYSNAGITGLPASGVSRIEFAIAPSDPNYMYALAAKSTSVATTNGKLEGVYQSVDKGVTWVKIGNGGSSQFEVFGGSTQSGQGEYDNTIAVFPANKTKIIIGGVSMWSWKQTNPNVSGIGQWSLAASGGGFGSYVHADVHTIKFLPTNPSVFYVGCDGGIFRGVENGNSFLYQAMNRGYNVTQFYSVAYPGDGLQGTGVIGGTQDNGTNYISGSGLTLQEAMSINGGDGGECEISYLNPKASFTTVYYGSLARHSSKGGAPAGFYNKRITDLLKLTNPNPAASFVTPIALYETKTSTNSPDTYTFINGKQTQTIPANGTKHYTGYLNLQYPSGSFVPDSVTFTAGTQVVKDDISGNLTGSISGTSNTINYATGYFDFNFANIPTGSVAITFHLNYNIGSSFTFVRPDFVDPLVVTTTNVIDPGDTVEFYDPFQAKLAVGFNGTNGVWMTKQPLNFSSTPKWIKLGTVAGVSEELAWSADGDVLYVGTDIGNLYRFSNLAAVKDSANGDIASPNTVVVNTRIAGFGGRFICGLSVDPLDNNKVAVSLGNYGQTNYVYYSTTAATCAASPSLANFSVKQGTGTSKLPAMPVYSVMIEKTNPNHVVVGTEHGVYSTDDITVANPVWSSENGTGTTMFPNVPTLKIRQQRRDGSVVNNPYVIYAGTHGRGLWKSNTLIGPVTVGINNPINNNNSTASFQSSLNVYPNPMNSIGTVAFELAESTSIVVSIYSLQGKLVKTINAGKLQSGEQKVEIDSEQLSKGSYLISVDGKNVHATTRFVVVK